MLSGFTVLDKKIFELNELQINGRYGIQVEDKGDGSVSLFNTSGDI